MCSLYSDILGQCVDQVAASLQCGDIQTGQEIVSFFVNSPRQVDTGTINTNELVEASFLLASSIDTVEYKKVF